MHDITMYAPDQSLAPADGMDWHVFVADDVAGRAALTGLVNDGLGRAVASLGSTAADGVLERRLSVTGPLENLSPGGAEDLLAMADAAGDVDVRARIVEALQRESVADPRDEYGGGGLPAYGQIDTAIHPKRRTRRRLERLLTDLTSNRVYARRIAASRLGGWDGDPAVVDALRVALRNADGSTRGFAALSLGQVADGDAGTWRQVLDLAHSAEAGPREIGSAIVLLAALDVAARREEAASVLDAMVAMYPAWTRNLRAFRERVAAAG
jgi:HEAT repeat protein